MASFISHKLKMIFCHIPRTAGTSFTEALKPHVGADFHSDRYEKHTPLKLFRVGEVRQVFDDYLKVSIFRDGSSRFKSLEKAKPENVGPKDDYWWTTKEWICDDQGKCLCDVLILFEALPFSALNFFRSIGLDIEYFPHLNRRGK